MNIFTEILILLSISYFIGSIPFGLILTNLWGYGDIRKIGSGNIGATNALRTGNKILALLVLLLDAFKSLFLIILFKNLELTNDNANYLFVLLSGTIIGHCFPIWLKFKGGKGIATMLGGLIGISFSIGFFICLIWVIIASITRRSSLSSILSISFLPITSFIFFGHLEFLISCFLLVIICFKHKENIFRLVKGKEPKIFEN